MKQVVSGRALKDLPVPGETLPEIFLKQRKIYGSNRVALRIKKDDEWLDFTWEDYYDHIEKVASSLLGLGLKPNDKISMISSNCPEWLFICLAAQCLGIYLVPVYPNVTPDQLRYVVEHSEAKHLFVQNPMQLAKTEPWREDVKNLDKIILMSGNTPKTSLSYSQFLSTYSDDKKRPAGFLTSYIEILTADSPGGIIYTSGTTGPPKGILLNQKNIVYEARGLYTRYNGIYEEDTVSFLPLSHIAEQIQNMSCAIALAFRVSFAQGIETIKDDLPVIQPTLFFSVPRLYEKVYSVISESVSSSPFVKRSLFNWGLKVGEKARIARNSGAELSNTDKKKWAIADKLVFSKVREKLGLAKAHFYLSGAAPLPVKVSKFFGAMGMDIFEVYGLTESTGVATATDPIKTIPGAIGPPLPGCDIAIADDGEILIRGDNVFKGYWKDQEKTVKALKDGWLYTGDIGHFNEDEYLCITDRKKDIIVTSGGKNTAPVGIENRLKGVPCISQAVVIGDRRKYLTCLFTLDDESLPGFCDRLGIEPLSAREARENTVVVDHIQKCVDKVNENLAGFETIKYFRILPENFSIETGELTPTMKVKRQVINQKYKHVIDSMY